MSALYDISVPVKAQADSSSDPPKIHIGLDDERMVDEAIKVVGGNSETRHIYQRSGRLVEIVVNDPGENNEGRPSVRSVPSTRLREILGADALWYFIEAASDGAKRERRVRPSSLVTRMVIDRGVYPGVPKLTGIILGPVLRPDGSVFRGYGYDPTTGLYGFGPSIEWPGELPDSNELRRLLRVIIRPFKQFPWPKRECWAVSCFLAYVLTLLARHAFTGPAPLFLVTANVRGSGKTLLMTCGSYIGTGEAPTMASSIGRGSEEEDRKAITSYAMGAENVVLLDNLAGDFRSAVLEQVLTSPDSRWSDRVLGGNTTWSGQMLTVFAATGNNVRIRGDLTRRVLPIELNSLLSRPEERDPSEFTHPNLLAYIRENHMELRCAALRLLEAYCAAGRPKRDLIPWGSYEGWSELVRGTIVWLGLPDPTLARQSIEDDDELHGAAVVEQLRLILGDGARSMTPGQIATLVGRDGSASDLREALVSVRQPRRDYLSSREVGLILSQLRGRVFDGWCIDRPATGDGQNRPSRLWTVRQV